MSKREDTIAAVWVLLVTLGGPLALIFYVNMDKLVYSYNWLWVPGNLYQVGVWTGVVLTGLAVWGLFAWAAAGIDGISHVR